MSEKKLKVTMVRSRIGRLASHKACLDGLGLKRINQRVEVVDTPANRGMIDKISYMLSIEEA